MREGAGGGASAAGVPSSTFKQPHYAAEVQDFLQNRATPEEASKVQRFLGLIQQATGATGQQHSPHKPRPATTTSCTASKYSLQQQQQLKRLSMASDADTTAPGSGNSSSWLYTTTAAAGALRPHSAQLLPPSSTQHIIAAAARSKAGRPLSAACISSAQPPSLHKTPAGSPLNTRNPAAGATSALPPKPSKPSGLKSVNITTSQAMHGLKDLYPDLWANTVPICRPDPAPNKNFISEWGESLRQGSGDAWKPYLATTNQLTNLQVAKPTDEFAVRADTALINWVAKQRTHFADLLSPQAAAAAAALLEGSAGSSAAAGSSSGSDSSAGLSVPERKEMVGVLRQLAAVVQPDRAKSTSHVHHCLQTSVEEAQTTALLKEQTRIRTMGFPRKVTVKGFTRPLSSTAALGITSTAGALQDAVHGSSGGLQQPAAGSNGGRKPAVRASEMIDTQKSKVPLKWAASNLVPPCSTYTSAHGTNPGQSPQMFRTKFREVTVGMGHVDQHTYPPGRHVYPVEALYLELPAKARPQAHDMKTTYRASFPAAAP